MAAKTGKIAGKDGLLFNGTTKVVGLTDFELEATADEIDASDHDSGGFKDYLNGLVEWKGTAKFMYQNTDATQKAVRDAVSSGAAIPAKFYPAGSSTGTPATGDVEFSGNVRILSWKYSSPNSGGQTMDVTFRGSGALTEGTKS